MKTYRNVINNFIINKSISSLYYYQGRLSFHKVSRENPKGFTYTDIYNVNPNPPPMPKPLKEDTLRGIQIEVAFDLIKTIISMFCKLLYFS